MATVVEKDGITITKFNTCDTVEVQIEDSEGNAVILLDSSIRFVFKTLRAWLLEDLDDCGIK